MFARVILLRYIILITPCVNKKFYYRGGNFSILFVPTKKIIIFASYLENGAVAFRYYLALKSRQFQPYKVIENFKAVAGDDPRFFSCSFLSGAGKKRRC